MLFKQKGLLYFYSHRCHLKTGNALIAAILGMLKSCQRWAIESVQILNVHFVLNTDSTGS